jgi:amino-acid N-acetyltransferase
LTIRPARVSDVPGICQQIQVYADRGLMIRRSLAELYQAIREFLVAVDVENRVVGCVALHVFWEDLSEIRCLAVAEHVHGLGIGRRLVDACWESARELEIKSIFALTTAAGFFERCGYQPIDKSELPQAVWSECVRCPSFPNCQEAALIRLVDREAVVPDVTSRLAAAEF